MFKPKNKKTAIKNFKYWTVIIGGFICKNISQKKEIFSFKNSIVKIFLKIATDKLCFEVVKMIVKFYYVK